MTRILADAALPPADRFFCYVSDHLALILGVVAAVAAVTAVVIAILVKKKKGCK